MTGRVKCHGATATAVGLQVDGRHAVPLWLLPLVIGPRGLRETVAFYWRPLLLVAVIVVVAVVLVARWIAGHL